MFLKWLRPKPEIRVEYVVDPHIGKRQLEKIMNHVDRTKYKVGDTLESVAYRQGQMDLADYIAKQIIGGKLNGNA